MTLFSAGVIGVGCTPDGAEPGSNDKGHPAPRDVDAIEGGGTSGGTVNGVLTMFVRAPNGAPVAGATVIVDAGATQIAETTDANGRVDFWDEALKPPLTAHVLHPELRYTTISNFEASVVTLALETRAGPAPAEMQIAVATGTITGWSMLPENTTERARIATVMAVGEDVEPVDQRPRPGTVTPGNPTGNPTNLVVNGISPFPLWDDYELRFDTRARALAAFGGTFTVGAETATEITHLGVHTGMAAMGSETVTGVDIEITHPLDHRLEAVVVNTAKLDNVEVGFGVELPGGAGVIPLGWYEDEPDDRDAFAPMLRDSLADARYTVAVRMWSEARVGDAPMSQVLARARGEATSYTFDEVLEPAGRPTGAGRTIAATPSTGAELHVFSIMNELTGEVLWQASVIGDATRALTLPRIPSELSDPLRGTLLLAVRAFDLGDVDLNNARFADVEGSIRSSAETRARVDF